METYSTTHSGLDRLINEDRYLIKPYGASAVLLALADGMGGETAGDLAADLAIEALAEFNPEQPDTESQLVALLEKAHLAIVGAIAERPELRGMGATLVAGWIQNLHLTWVSVGDSRLYLYRDLHLHRLTTDHNMPGALLKRGEITEAQAFAHPMKNALMRCLGCKKYRPDSGQENLAAGDLLFLSSDGLHDEVPHEQIAGRLKAGGSLADRLNALEQAALDAGGPDNITLVGAQM